MITTLITPIRALRCALSVLLLGLAVKLCAAPVAFDIPAQPAAEALDLFIKQSGANVVYLQADVQGVSTNAVQGNYEPAAALDLLLKNTVLVFTESKPNEFAVGRTKPGSIEGSVQSESGKPVAGARVSLTSTKQVTVTDKRGRFSFEDVPAGSQSLTITAEGMQNTKVTDVTVKAGHHLTLSTIPIPEAAAGAVQLEDYVVSAKKNMGVVELDPYEVSGAKSRPFTDRNVDIPRSENDVQPYFIAVAKAIEQSGSTNVEEFLKNFLPMNTVAFSNKQNPTNVLGNLSSIDLRGLGTDKTLVLINGRRTASVPLNSLGDPNQQPDLNGIPMAAIERIEVLPSSASGIYGGSAIGGVINVILKQNYLGGEFKVGYKNTWDSDAPLRSASLTYGGVLHDGKTNFFVGAQWNDATPLLLQDRQRLFSAGLGQLLRNRPASLFSSTVPFLGTLPNISPSTAAGTLILKSTFGGTNLNSRNSYVAAGTGPDATPANLGAMLLQNAGQWNLTNPPTSQSPGGLYHPLESTYRTRSSTVVVQRKVFPKFTTFAEFTYNDNRTMADVFPIPVTFTVAANAPTNPFTQAVRIRIPSTFTRPYATSGNQRGVTVGFKADLPADWRVHGDFTHSENSFSYTRFGADTALLGADLNAGVLNPFVDILRFPLPFEKYVTRTTFDGRSVLSSAALRGSGMVWQTESGPVVLTAGLEDRVAKLPANALTDIFPETPTRSTVTRYFPQRQQTDSVYSELAIPIPIPGGFPGIRSAEVQAAGRWERYRVRGGTTSAVTNIATNVITYSGPTLNGQPFSESVRYKSLNETFGFKFEGAGGLTLRASRATAFLPPQASQLVENPLPNATLTTITDPQNGAIYEVQTRSGGNSKLKPQNSVSRNIGVIWSPKWRGFAGFRLNVEYYQIDQFDEFGALDAQAILGLESRLPERVFRDAGNTVTLVDTSLINLTRLTTEGVDIGVDFRAAVWRGMLGFHAAATYILHEMRQVTSDSPLLDYAGYSGGPAKQKAVAGITWESSQWSMGWNVRYFGSYKQFGAAGSPISIQAANGGVFGTVIEAQGGDTILAQAYHDAFVIFRFGKGAKSEADHVGRPSSRLTSNLTLHVGIENIFGTIPPFDASYSPFYISPYGDKRLRSYSVSLKKTF